MADWATISSLATAGGTLVLAVATFQAVRSSNRSARIAELALREQRRPLFAQSRNEDATERIMFGDQHWVSVDGSGGAAEYVDGIVYLVMSLRNIGAGIGVCQGWHVQPGLLRGINEHSPEDQFRLQGRDLYIPAGDMGLWQGAIREANDPQQAEIAAAITHKEPVSIELLYSDQVGEQRTISRYSLIPFPHEHDDGVTWAINATRHWYLDRAGPR
ncbi:MAG TPA: hypothetical protein VME22_16285 [Solirubrobacteraceae bacterium]|nr:hypothetical protein [Solirubrobacteraceae bacterium]